MARKSTLALEASELLLLLLTFVFTGTWFSTKNPYVTGADVDKGCDELVCKLGEQCVSRTFWCVSLPCPSMSYCSKSRRESLKGPENCHSVQCPFGYKCTVRVRDCEWNHKCRDRVARCVTEKEFLESPTSCTDVVCPKGHLCVLRETHCIRPPCKLTKSCARKGDVDGWFERCKRLGCHSEHDCFLRRPPEKCSSPPCSHVPDCLSTIDLGDEEQCRGWICPANFECKIESSCHDCPVTRYCQEPLSLQINSTKVTDVPPRRTLGDLEKEIFLPDRRKIPNFRKVPFTANFTKLMKADESFDDVEATGISMSYRNPDDMSTSKAKRVTMLPNMRSTSSGYSPWLTYLKRKAGSEAVQYWIEKAKNNEDYEEFVDWLESVAGILEPETYRLWLREIELFPELQSWISLRNLELHGTTVAQFGIPSAHEDIRSDQDDIEDARRIFQSSIGRRMKDPELQPPRAQDFSDIMKNSWKSWQSHYQQNPIPSNSPVFPVPTANMNPYYFRNNTNPQLFFPNVQLGFDQPIADPNLNQWPSIRKGDTTLKRVKLNDDYYSRHSESKSPLPAPLESMIDHFSGHREPKVMNLDPSQPMSDILFPPKSEADGNMPNLLIYFPPPLNFFIYYTGNNQSQLENHTVQESMPAMFPNSHLNSPFNLNLPNPKTTPFPEYSEYSNSPDRIPISRYQTTPFSTFQLKQRFSHNKPNVFDKQREIDYIRKIIKELLDYWEQQEKTIEREGKIKEFNVPQVSDIPTINEFMDWLSQKTDLLDVKPRKKEPPSFIESSPQPTNTPGPTPTTNSPPTSFGRTTNLNSNQKIRILVDVDKNPEVMKALFSKNRTNNKNEDDPREYQVIVNVNDLIDGKEEELITRRLMDIASNQFHRNITNDMKMPKILWVFPVYEDEENQTVAEQINKIQSKQTNTMGNTGMDNDRNHQRIPIRPPINVNPKDQIIVTKPTSPVSEYEDDLDDYDDYTYEDFDKESYEDTGELA